VILAALLLALACVTPRPAVAASSKEDEARRALQASEQQKAAELRAGKDATDRAARAAADAEKLAQQRVQAAARLQAADAATQDVAARIDALAASRRAAEERLKSRAAALQPLLPLIQRLSLYPVETLLAIPETPEDTIRGMLVLKGLSRQIEVEAEALKKDQADLDAATAALRAEEPRLTAARAEQAREAEALDRQIAAARQDQEKAGTEATLASNQAAAAAARADSLRAMLSTLEAERRAEEAARQAAAARAREEAERAERQRRTAEAQAAREREAALTQPAATGSMAPGSITTGGAPAGQLQPPVVGVVVKSWGEPTDGGPSTGVSYNTPPGARVVSPCAGRVVFADSFRSYGLLMIVDCGGSYHVVLAGFDRMDVRPGQHVVAGEPVGVMPSWEPGSTARRPALYVELRRGGQPVNPAPWLRSSS
jgi:septal ring factor EnvC (AmiA/AmiB activator)